MSDHASFSEDLMIMLGAYVDGALTADECQTVDEMAANEPSIAAEHENLFLLNTDLNSVMDSLLDMPIPPAPMPADTNATPLRALAASLVIGAALGAAGM
jgi:anti-sigma factor RsiW